MLSVQIVPPSSGTTNFTSGLASENTSPDQAIVMYTSPLVTASM